MEIPKKRGSKIFKKSVNLSFEKFKIPLFYTYFS